MTTQVQTSELVNVPVSRAYNQWTQFEDFPRFMDGVQSVTQLSDDRLQWVAQIGGVRREWEARILEQVPDQKIAWAATEGATNAGAVTFEDVGGGQTSITLFLEYEPEGVVENVADRLNIVKRQAEGDLRRFKEFIESEGYATGAWRGEVPAEGHVGTPGVEHAAESRGDSGKAGLSGAAVAAGLGAAAAGVAAAAALGGRGDDEADGTQAPEGGATEGRVVPTDVVVPDDAAVPPAVPAETAVPEPIAEPGLGAGAGAGEGSGQGADAARGYDALLEDDETGRREP